MLLSLSKTLISSVLLGSLEIKLLSATRLGSQRKLSPVPVDSYAVVGKFLNIIRGSFNSVMLLFTEIYHVLKLYNQYEYIFSITANRAKGTVSFIKEGDTPSSGGTAVPDTQVVEVGGLVALNQCM